MTTPKPVDASPLPRGPAPRILVAEDDLEMRRLVMDSLRRDGYDVVDVTDGGELLVRLTEFHRLRQAPEPIDLVVTDVRMPGCSGFDILEALRDANWRTPVIVMTAFADDDARAQAKRLDAVLLEKPFEMLALRAQVREILRAAGKAA